MTWITSSDSPSSRVSDKDREVLMLLLVVLAGELVTAAAHSS
jgi:hypothetical protein